MRRNIIQVPGTNEGTLARARFRSRILFNVTTKFQENFAKLKMINIQKYQACT